MTVLWCPADDVQWGTTGFGATDPTCWFCEKRTGVEPAIPRYDLCGTCRGLVTDVTGRWCSPSGRPQWHRIIDEWVERGEREARERSAMAGVW